MTRYLGRRLLMSLISMFIVLTVVFVLIRLAPGDPARKVLGSEASPEAIQAAHEKWGLDQPLVTQYFFYLQNIIHGDFGESFTFQRSAVDVLAMRLPATIFLATVAFLLTLVVAIPLGILMAIRPRGRFDSAANVVTVVGQSMPDFWIAIMLILIFAVTLRLLPTSGLDKPTSVVLPAITIAILTTAVFARVTRRELIRVNDAPFIMAARSRGLSDSQILRRHALRNAAIPIVTIAGLTFVGLLNGVVVVEFVFAWPGIGYTAIEALSARDYPVLQTIVVVTSVFTILVTLLIDLLYTLLDPRVRLGATSTR